MDIEFSPHSRIFVIEGISGSGKDTFQKYLKEALDLRHVHDYSEGEVLHSWKHLQIQGILEIRLKFMKQFTLYMKDVITRDEQAVFLLNRFHLSTYLSTVIQQPELEGAYDEIVRILKNLPVHVFLLQLDESEMENRSRHPERCAVWRKHQQQIVTKDGFRNRLERYVWQQELMLKLARRQQIPYSTVKVSHARADASRVALWT